MTNSSSGGRAELDLFELFATLWREKLLVFSFVVVFSSAGLIYALMAEPSFRAETVVSPVEHKSTMGSLGQLASLAGISLTPGGESKNPVAVLRSRNLALTFITEHQLVPLLLSELAGDAGPRGNEARKDPGYDERDALELFENQVLSVSENSKTGLVTVAVRWKEPALAAQWAEQLIDFVNSEMQADAVRESTRNVAYLKNEIQQAELPVIQQALSKLLESEMQKLLMAQSSEEFAFRVIDRPIPPKYKESPKRALICLASAFAGLLAGVVCALLREGVRRRREAA